MSFDIYLARHYFRAHRNNQEGRPYLVTRSGTYRSYADAERNALAMYECLRQRGSNVYRNGSDGDGYYDYVTILDGNGNPCAKPVGAIL